jgi:hypothetical protein
MARSPQQVRRALPYVCMSEAVFLAQHQNSGAAVTLIFEAGIQGHSD